MPSSKILSLLGLILSSYALYVEYRHKHEDSSDLDSTPFVALCDIELINASCSKTFALPQGKLLSYFGFVEKGSTYDIANPVLGLLYYIFILLLEGNNIIIPKSIILFASIMAMSSSIFLAYELTRLNELCILCWSTHLINTLLLYNSYISYTASTSNTTKQSSNNKKKNS